MTLDRDALKAQLIDDEGLVLHAYQDHLGYWTIGVGHLIDDRRGGHIPKHIALLLLDWDIDEKQAAVLKRWPWMTDLDPARFGVVVQMAFQLGVKGLAGFHGFLGHLQAGRYADAAASMLASLWAEQTPNRARRLAGVMRG